MAIRKAKRLRLSTTVTGDGFLFTVFGLGAAFGRINVSFRGYVSTLHRVINSDSKLVA